MRLTFLFDNKITQEELDELQRQFSDIYSEHAGIDPVYFEHTRDYSFYPTFTDSDGDKRPSNKFLTDESDFVHKKYGTWGTDHVVILIHEDNWLSPTIWGTNYSNIFHGYHVHYCRFDRDNMANSLGTLYHEVGHSLDALIATETGVNIAPLVGVTNFDRDFIHGAAPQWKYIRWKENLDGFKYFKDLLKKSYTNRKARFDTHYNQLKTVVQLLQTLIVLLRQQFNRKNGVNKLCSKNSH